MTPPFLRPAFTVVIALWLVACGGGGGGGDAADQSGRAAPLSGSPDPNSYRAGDLLVLERNTDAGLARVAVDLTRGGMIVEAGVAGRNVVNADDTGRGVQFALYDGAGPYDNCAGCSGQWGWNPVQGGNRANVGSPVTSWSVQNRTLTITTKGRQWSGTDDDQITIEQAVTAVDNEPFAFRVAFRIAYSGTQDRVIAMQELPAAYAGSAYRTLIGYSGSAPWTSGALSTGALPPMAAASSFSMAAPERWFSLVDGTGHGLTLYAPGADATVRGFATADTAFARLDQPLSLVAGQVLSGHYFLIVGDHRAARDTVYRLRAQQENQTLDLTAPVSVVDTPAATATVSGMAHVSGWSVDDRAVASVEVRLDGQRLGDAALGIARPDVQAAVPGAPGDAGFGFNFDSRSWPNGAHVLQVKVTDHRGNAAVRQRTVQIAN
ncbi:Ig-like domain-containing protein [Aquabacterium sp. J223]|uniref:Ig-like domain-containing protein n=1 Tax=Aquabacterium sp. J223 TaxID=2898431 RepID=UPI0021ADE5F0|nr:Ig-like domain-containing protein [Aquabacterium sp. J223]UUX94134.1 Ig-like domain-containing protein [Aquabacterium sp. J223]